MPRSAVLALATSAATLALAAPAAASHSGEGGPRDFAVGSADNQLLEISPFDVFLKVSAHGVDDETPSPLFGARHVTGQALGSGTLPNGAFQTKGEVTCVKVVGNRATIKYRFRRTSGPGAPSEGWGVQVFIEDNGRPEDGVPDGNATDAPLPAAMFEAQADQCELPRGPFNPVDAGDYVVHDADPLLPPLP